MTEECITPLRRRMIEDMNVRHFASKTQHDYIRTVMKLTRFLGRSPDTATNEDLRRWTSTARARIRSPSVRRLIGGQGTRSVG